VSSDVSSAHGNPPVFSQHWAMVGQKFDNVAVEKEGKGKESTFW
jgi:hypothetical protein